MGSSPGQRAMGAQAGTEMSPGFMDWWNNRMAGGAAGSLSGGLSRNSPAPAPNYSLGGPSGATPIAPTTTGTATSGPALPPPMVLPAAPRVNLAQVMAAAQAYTGRSQASMRR
jgi:hypothetical protein